MLPGERLIHFVGISTDPFLGHLCSLMSPSLSPTPHFLPPPPIPEQAPEESLPVRAPSAPGIFYLQQVECRLPGASGHITPKMMLVLIVSLLFFKANYNKNMETGNEQGPREQSEGITIAAGEGDCREVDCPPFPCVLFLACVFQSK